MVGGGAEEGGEEVMATDNEVFMLVLGAIIGAIATGVLFCTRLLTTCGVWL